MPRWWLVVLSLGGFWLALVTTRLPFVGGPYQGTDWLEVFGPAARLVNSGIVPYGTIAAASHPIHLYLSIGFTAYVPAEYSYGLWVAASLGITAWAARLLTGEAWQSTLAIMAGPFLALVVLLGEVTAIEVLGAALLFLALEKRGNQSPAALLMLALFALSSVPPNAIPLGAWGAFRLYRKNRVLTIIALVMVALLIGSTLLLYGNWLAFYVAIPAQSWEANQTINLSLWARAPFLAPLALAVVLMTTRLVWENLLSASTVLQLLYTLAVTCLVSPYLLGHRLLPLYVLLCAHLAKMDSRLPLVLLAFSWLLFLASLYIEAQFLYLFPLVAWVVAIASLYKEKGTEYGYSGA